MDALGMFSQAVTGFTGGMMAQAEKSKAEDIAAEERMQKRKVEDLTLGMQQKRLGMEEERLGMEKTRQATELAYAEQVHEWEKSKQDEWNANLENRKRATTLELTQKETAAELENLKLKMSQDPKFGVSAQAKIQMETLEAKQKATENELEVTRRSLLSKTDALREEWSKSPIFQGEEGEKNLEQFVRFSDSMRLRVDMMASDPRLFLAAKGMAARKASASGADTGASEAGIGAEVERLSRALKNLQEIAVAPAETPEQKELQAKALTDMDKLHSYINKTMTLADGDPRKEDAVDSAVAIQAEIDSMWRDWTGAKKGVKDNVEGKARVATTDETFAKETMRPGARVLPFSPESLPTQRKSDDLIMPPTTGYDRYLGKPMPSAVPSSTTKLKAYMDATRADDMEVLDAAERRLAGGLHPDVVKDELERIRKRQFASRKREWRDLVYQRAREQEAALKGRKLD